MTAGATIGAVVVAATEALEAGRIQGARLDAEVLLADLLGVDRAILLAYPERSLPGDTRSDFEDRVRRRLGGEPVAYITGKREFYGLPFHCDRRALIPRPESEGIVDLALAEARRLEGLGRDPVRLVDLGTGSGAIAIALAVHLPRAEVVATDVTPDAVEVARGNAERNGVGDRMHLSVGDLFAGLEGEAPFDVMTMNPPYVGSRERGAVCREVLEWEPEVAVFAPADDHLRFYRRLAAGARRFLRPEGLLIVEAGLGHADEVVEVFETAGWGTPVVTSDLAGIERLVAIRPTGRV